MNKGIQTDMTGNAQTNAIKVVKRSYDEKMKRKYEHVKSKRVHDLLLKVERKTKDWTLQPEV